MTEGKLARSNCGGPGTCKPYKVAVSQEKLLLFGFEP